MKKFFTAAALMMVAGAGVVIATSVGTPPEQGDSPAEKQVMYDVVKRRDNHVSTQSMAGGTNLYGFVSDWEDELHQMWRPYRGVFEISEYGDLTKLYADPAMPDIARMSTAFLLDGCLYGYGERYVDENDNWGEWSFMKVDFETGEVLEKVSANSGVTASPLAYNPKDGYFYFARVLNREWCRSTIANPSDIEVIATFPDNKSIPISLAYCPEDSKFYGVTTGNKFVTVAADGAIENIANIPSRNTHAAFKAGMTWAPAEGVFYWNYLGQSGVSNIYTVTREGNFNLECSLERNANLDWLVTPDEKYVPAAPKAPELESVVFTEGALSGVMTFVMPEQMQNGNDLPEEVNWTVTLDGEVYKEGTSVPGEKVSVDLTDIESGNHEFGVFATFDVFSCDPVTTRLWVGHDVPMAPTSVALTKTAVSWIAPTAGVHAGYVDFSAMTYDVKINDVFGNTVFATETTETSVDYSLENPEDLSLYTAYVAASSNGLTSVAASSAGLIMGDAMTPPVEFAPTPDEFRMMTVYDKNNDGNTWGWVPDHGGVLLSGNNQVDIKAMDDYLFLPAMNFSDTERIYEISLNTSSYSPNFLEEYLGVVLAMSPDYDGVIESLVDRTKIPCAYDRRGNQISEWTHLRSNFQVPEPGVYYIGFHCSSSSQMAGVMVRDIVVNDGGVLGSSPAAVDKIETTPAEDGVLEATVDFIFPTKTVAGADLAEDAALTATVSSSVATVTVQGTPGSEAQVTISTVQGDNEIGIIITDTRGYNSPSAMANVFTGVTIPDHVTNVRGIISDDMLEFTLMWDAPTVGEQGGYINPDELTYNVYVYDPWGATTNWVPLSKGQTEREYKYYPDEQDYYRLAIEAVNAAGASEMVSGSAWAGPAYTLPYEDGFNNASQFYETKPWRIMTQGYHANWGFDHLFQVDPALYGQDNQKLAMVCRGVEGSLGCVTMPRFSTLGQDDVNLAMDVYTGGRAAKVSITGYAAYNLSQQYNVGELPSGGEEGIHTVYLKLPAVLLGQPWVQLLINVDIQAENAYFACTGVRVDAASGVTLAGNAEGSISGADGAVRFVGLAGAEATVSAVDGRVVANGTLEGADVYWYLEPGVYAVTCGQLSTKILVK